VEVFYKISRSLHFIKEGAVIRNNMRLISGCFGIRTIKQVKLYVLRKLIC